MTVAKALLILFVIASSAVANVSYADTKKAKKPETAKSETSAKPGPQVPPPEVLLLMVRSNLLTLNDAIQTGNFTVLRDKAATSFRDKNSAADLSDIFSDLRRRNINLAPVAVVTPQVTEAPAITDQNLLRISGYFPTKPLQIHFHLLFQAAQGQWRLFGLSVNTKASNESADAVPDKQ